MNRQPVTSSTVESVGFDDDSSTLEIAFHDGSVYQYFDVPRAVYDMLVQAESPEASCTNRSEASIAMPAPDSGGSLSAKRRQGGAAVKD